MSIGERLRAARKAKNWTQAQLAEASKVKQGSISQIERGDQQNSIHTVALAMALNVPAEWLSEGTPENHQPKVEEGKNSYDSEHMLFSRQADPANRIPIVGNAQAGPEGYWDDHGQLEHGDGFIVASSNDPDAYALRVRGDSMAPTIKNGQIVVIEPNNPPHLGENVLVCTTDGLCMIKEYRLYNEADQEYTFGSINDTHPAITVQKINVTRLQPITMVVASSQRQA